MSANRLQADAQTETSWMIAAMFFVASAAAILFLWRPELAAFWFWGEMSLLLVVVVATIGYWPRQKQLKNRQVAQTSSSA